MNHPVVTLVFAIVALAVAILAVKYAFTKESMIVRPEYYTPAVRTVRNPRTMHAPVRVRVPKRAKWAPSPVDATMVPNGSWDTNRNPARFVTNVGVFPVPADSDAVPDGLKWKSDLRQAGLKLVPQMPDVTFSTGFSDPPVGGEDYDGLFGPAGLA